MVSRLDRLFILLDTGSNESVRLAAAKQIGEVQRVKPNDLNYLLQRIKEYSSKSIWETRVAAGHATRSVLEQLSPWPPKIDQQQDHPKHDAALDLIKQNVDIDKIFDQFELEKIVALCPKLSSIDNIEDDSQSAASSSSSRGRGARGRKESRTSLRKNDKEQLMRQRKLINKELGIAMVDSLNLGVRSTDIVSNCDLQAEYDSGQLSPATEKSSANQQDAKTIIQQLVSNYEKTLIILSQSNCISSEFTSRESKVDNNSANSQLTQQSTGPSWPLIDIAKQYSDDLFNSSWEVRHGAATALREIVKLQGKSAGKRTDLSKLSNDQLNQSWLVDMALKALSVLALDKFGDFLFDQVVAPVRENAAQLLGCCVAHMSEPNAYSTIKLLLKMLDSPNWETRHGGILGLKYSLNVFNESFSKTVLQECFDPIFKCLGDKVDDVSAEAAAALVPVKDLMIETIPSKAPELIRFLWNHLADLDEITSSTSNIVLLLASLITSSSAQLEPVELNESIPRLWSLLGHSSTSVRISVLKAIITLTKPQKSRCLAWMPEELLTTALRLIFQRCILENMDEVRPFIEEVWMQLIGITHDDQVKSQVERFKLLKCTSQFLNYWLCLILQPSNSPIDRASNMWLNINADGSRQTSKPEGEVYIGSCTFNAESLDQQKFQVTKCRLLGAKLVGALYANLINDFDAKSPGYQHAKDTLKYLADMFIHYIRTKSANQRIISGWALESWASYQAQLLNNNFEELKSVLPQALMDHLDSALQENSLCYDELASTFTRLQQETRDFVTSAKSLGIEMNSLGLPDKRIIYNLNQIQSLCEMNLESELTVPAYKKPQNASKDKPELEIAKREVLVSLSNKQASLSNSLKSTILSQKSLSTSVLSSLACAHISWRLIPQRTDLVTKPLLDSVENEEDQSLQDKSINYLVILFELLSKNLDKHKDLLENILDRLIDSFGCKTLSIFELDEGSSCVANSPLCSLESSKKYGFDIYKIILLDNLQRKALLTRSLSRRQSSIIGTSSLKRSHSQTSSMDFGNDTTAAQDISGSRLQPEGDMADLKLRGASIAINRLSSHFGAELPEKLPRLWDCITKNIQSNGQSKLIGDEQNELKLIKSLRLLEIVGESLHDHLKKHLLDLFNDLINLLTVPNPVIRHHSSQCIGMISKLMLNEVIALISEKIIPMLDNEDDILARCGAIEAVALIIEHLRLELVPYINMFTINVLRRMSDQNDQVRLMATHCFGKLLSLMPLDWDKRKDNASTSQPSTGQVKSNHDDQRFIEQLMDSKKLDNFSMPFEMKAELRSYQQDGLNWLAFLNRFNLHGILCDEMGLGKTLMTICMVASDHYLLMNDKGYSHSSQCPPSLIVCPPTLTGHWFYEIEKFILCETRSVLNPVLYTGNMSDRMVLRCEIQDAISKSKENSLNIHEKDGQIPINLVIASYDIVRNDIDFFKAVHWNYCVLDEGHIIKNGKSKLSRAIRLLTARHRLILSGTPIQNNVTELWSLFDFLMPGFLGSERQFNSRFAKPILQSREPKCSARDLEAGALAMESLHRQVLPFVLRRLKEDVLEDLPPKIIQDYYCELSPLQSKLYEDFTRSKLCSDVTKKSIKNLDDNETNNAGNMSDERDKSNSRSHVFQALQYLKNVCNHPKLVLTEKHSQYLEVKKSLDKERSSLNDIGHSSKLKALKQLLIDCGIGVANQSSEEQQQDLALQSVVNQHRALIFCQIRSMVDIIENDLLKVHLPTITYLKLDGSVPTAQRHSIVSRFNNDPSIDILLLTTQIGGLGLNLTGADTVIFVEHDWNPTKDLQAMDRAHRIGQKKVVNVYRLITKGTLEEKIMGLQKFKTMVSNTVINQDNAGLGTMNVDQLFDLFEDTTARDKNSASSAAIRNVNVGYGKSSFTDLLPELWDQQQYETEYDLSNFVSSLKN